VCKWDEFGHWQECVVCGEAKSVTAHKYKVKDCTEQAECTDKNCGYIKPAGEHLWGKAKTTKKVTCVEDGILTYTCADKDCKETYEVTVDAHGEEEIAIEEIPATCTENGKTAKIVCSECDKVLQKQKVIKKGHSLTQLHFNESGHWYECDICGHVNGHSGHVSNARATDTAAEVCAECGYEITPVVVHEHNFGFASDANSHWGACECGEKLAAESHAWDMATGRCSVCQVVGVQNTESQNWDFVWLIIAGAVVTTVAVTTIVMVRSSKKRKAAQMV
jgi:hypothetical protein